MISAFKLTGFFAAHAIWSVSDGETLIPMLAYTTAGGEQRMERLVSETFEESIARGKEMLAANQMGATDAALLYDGRITVGDQKLDAILIEVRTFASPGSEAILAVPYTPKKGFFSKFKVHRAKLIGWENCDQFDVDAALQSFFDGIDGHEKGAKIWSKCLDESK